MITSLSQPVRHLVNVPIEQFYMFGVDNTESNTQNTEYIVRDEDIPNRYWLKFPPTWRTAEQKERVIGIRSLWLSQFYQRSIVFNIHYDSKSGKEDRWFVCNVRYDEALIEKLNETIDKIDPQIMFYFAKTVDNHFVLAMESIPEHAFEFQLTDMSPDAVFVLNNYDAGGTPRTETDMSDGHYFIDVWDRRHVMFTSSIATNTSRNEVGFSEVRYMPVKYFKVNSNETRFWIDLWIGRVTHIPAVLPRDDKDGFNLEVIFLHDDDELYT